VTIVSQPDRFVAVDFAPPRRAGRPYIRIAAAALALMLIGGLVVGVTQLLLR
jgi:hypothetical protein